MAVPETTSPSSATCLRIRVRGEVQGVGFRPFVHRLASQLAISGWVRNDAQGVDIEAQGAPGDLEQLVARLSREAPPMARVRDVEARSAPAVERHAAFEIRPSASGIVSTSVTADAAVCGDCLHELFDASDRRWRYAFINCTHCGPRYTITNALPYDRPQTSMAGFALCPECRREYDDCADRRFHAQPNACPACGPRLALRDPDGTARASTDPVADALAIIKAGGIVAIKGLGGFHLACDALNARTVAELRLRKNREEKPFAVMACNAVSLARFADCTPEATALLESSERPVVLLRKRDGCDAALAGVAPGLAWLGAMLPYTPLQYLLFHERWGRPRGTAWLGEEHPLMLVMTSANPGGEPIVRGDDEAVERLAGIADAILTHDRAIVTRCDDSVVRPGFQFIRRARGYTPRAIRLAKAGPPVLAAGPFFKNTICITRGDEAFVSQHIGDLDNVPTCEALEETAGRLMELLDVRPERVAHDLHPDFHSTRYACDLAQRLGIGAVGVQHHHAHIAAVAAEHGLTGPLLGFALDGVGLGVDGEAWGGEILAVEGARFERLGHLRTLQLPGADRAAREPWRMGVAALHMLARDDEIADRFPARDTHGLRQLLGSRALAPETSSCGRWFDAAAALVGVRDVSAFEGQAAMLLEGLAEKHGEVPPLARGFFIDADDTLDLSPLLDWLCEGREPALAAATFHATLAHGLSMWCARAVARTGIRRVAFGGGCFLNRLLSKALRERLARLGVEVLEARQVPPNDGGVSLGQAWVALQASV